MSKISRRQLLKGLPLAAAAAVLPAMPTEDQPAEAAPEVTPAALAWSQIPEDQRSSWYCNQEWKANRAKCYTENRADSVRVVLRVYQVYPYVKSQADYLQDHPRPEDLRANQRAALHQLIEELGPADLAAVNELCRVFVMHPDAYTPPSDLRG